MIKVMVVSLLAIQLTHDANLRPFSELLWTQICKILPLVGQNIICFDISLSLMWFFMLRLQSSLGSCRFFVAVIADQTLCCVEYLINTQRETCATSKRALSSDIVYVRLKDRLIMRFFFTQIRFHDTHTPWRTLSLSEMPKSRTQKQTANANTVCGLLIIQGCKLSTFLHANRISEFIAVMQQQRKWLKFQLPLLDVRHWKRSAPRVKVVRSSLRERAWQINNWTERCLHCTISDYISGAVSMRIWAIIFLIERVRYSSVYGIKSGATPLSETNTLLCRVKYASIWLWLQETRLRSSKHHFYVKSNYCIN